MNDGTQNDERLIAEFARGRRDALRQLAERYERRLLGLALGVLDGRRDLAAEAVQETWLRVIRFAKNFRGLSTFRTWLYRIAISRCRELVRKPGERTVPDDAPVAAVDDPSSAERDEAAGDLRHALAELPLEQRAVIVLCYHDGLPHEQAAQILEIPLGTLKSRLSAALRELRRRLPAEVYS